MKVRMWNGVLALPLTSELDWGEWSTPHLGRFDSLKRPVPAVQKAGGRGPKTECGKSYPQRGWNPGHCYLQTTLLRPPCIALYSC